MFIALTISMVLYVSGMLYIVEPGAYKGKPDKCQQETDKAIKDYEFRKKWNVK